MGERDRKRAITDQRERAKKQVGSKRRPTQGMQVVASLHTPVSITTVDSNL
jgi:hypothetical protein